MIRENLHASGDGRRMIMMNIHWWILTVVVVFLIFGGEHHACDAQSAQGQGLEPWASNTDPTDVAKRHVEEITAGRHEYAVVQGGTMDGRNCRSPLGVGMNMEGALEQTWQSNRAVRMENTGETDVVNPWLSNGRNLFRTVDEIVAAAVTPRMSDREKAMAIWFQETRYRYHFGADNSELADPVKVFNVYGYYTCGSNATHLAGLWRKAGLRVSAAAGTLGHTTSRVFYDGLWHYLDGNQHTIFLLRDNETVASDQDLVRDHDLVKRTHTMGILLGHYRRLDESFAAYFAYQGEVGGERNGKVGTTMNMTLRPGEALIWRWGHLNPPKIRGSSKPRYTDTNTICNGQWEYRPDFTSKTWRKGAAALENIKSGPDGLAAEEGKTGTIVWIVRSPYVFVGGRLEKEGSGAKFSLSWDGKSWQNVTEANLDSFFPAVGQAPRYQYHLRCQLSGEARLKRLAIINDLQMAPLVLPAMAVGENAFTYTDHTPGHRKVRITHEWVERSTSRPPEAPHSPVAPSDDGEPEGTDIVFRWNAPEDPDGDKITDYHFELSNRPDIRWPLSTNFYRLISRTKDKGKSQYTLPYVGLLTPDKRYYWHVRAKDDRGVWGPWSKTWSFTPQGPAYPLEVTLDYDENKGLGILKWKPNPVGRKPVEYRVYGSDEKGFSVSDEAYKAVVGISKEVTSPFPANFIAQTTATELAVLGAKVNLPAANKVYYRVVAVDEQGKRSGPSDYAAAPRPIIYSEPAVAAVVGAEYRYQVLANRSLGDLTNRVVDGKLPKNFWDVEKPAYSLEQGPKWLALDANSGLLSGTPKAAGKTTVVVTVTIDRQVRKLDSWALGWGQEKVIGTTTRKIGSAAQQFVIDVRK